MKKMKLSILSLMVLCLVITSCKKDDKVIEPVEVKVTFTLPQGLSYTLKEISLKITNKETGESLEKKKLSYGKVHVIPLKPGVYNISANTTIEEGGKNMNFSAIASDFSVGMKSAEVALLLLPQIKGGFVIRELFYSGGVHDVTSKPYKTGADYVIIVNNSDRILYADSLVFAGTASNTAIDDERYRKHLPEIGVQFMFMVPGDGKTYPVKPGEEFVICSEAKNHNEVSKMVPDLSKKAKFEWFEPNDNFQLTDNPAVKNMEILYKTSMSITALHIRGNTSYFIFKMPMSMEKLMEEHAREIALNNPSMPPIKCPFIPDAWVSDAVELSNGETINAKALPASVDVSFTFCSEMRKGYTIQRKLYYTVADRNVYVDNNDSANDFLKDLPSSILPK